MHIGFRTSGGRGEYELVGGHAGRSVAELDGWTLQFLWPDGIVRDTELWLDPAGSGKPRLRSLASQPFQIGRIMCAFLMLPPARREIREGSVDETVIRSKEFVVTKVGFGQDTSLASPPEVITATPVYVEASNSLNSEFIHVGHRWQRIAVLLSRSGVYPEPLAGSLQAFSDFVASGSPADHVLSRIVNEILVALGSARGDYVVGEDPVFVLEAMAGLSTPDVPQLPAPSDLSDDEGEIKVRSAQMHRLARVRDYKARVFSHDVRAAYGYRCAFCGGRFGNIPNVKSGIDAAHILAWGSYELDVVSNGIALCKNHHWAFDAGLLLPVLTDGSYSLRFTNVAHSIDSATLAILGTDGAAIPDDRLPVSAALRPSQRYLSKLYDDLAVRF